MHYFGAVCEPAAPGSSLLCSHGSIRPVWWRSASPCRWSSCPVLLCSSLTVSVKLDYEILPILDLAGCVVKRNLKPFLPQHNKNFQYQTSGMFPEALFLLIVRYCTPCRKKKRQTEHIQHIPSIDERALNTAVGGRMEGGNTDITFHLNPAQQGSSTAKLGKGICLSEHQHKTAQQWVSYTFIPY